MDHAPVPLSFELSFVATHINAGPIDAVALPTAMIRGRVGPQVAPHAIFLPGLELTLVPAALLPDLDTITMLQVVLPLPFVRCDLLVAVDSKAMGDIVAPLATVYISVCVHESALSFSAVGSPLPNIDSTIRPPLYTSALPLVSTPLPMIGGTITEGVHRPRLLNLTAVWRQRLQLMNILVKVRLTLLR